MSRRRRGLAGAPKISAALRQYLLAAYSCDRQGLSDYALPLTNAASNGDFVNTTGWYGSASTVSVSNKTLIAVGNGTGANVSANCEINTFKPSGKSFGRARVRVTNAVCTNLSIVALYYQNSTYVGEYNYAVQTPAENIWYSLSGLITNRATADWNNIRFYVRSFYADVATATSKVMEVQEVMCIDLSTPFGLSNEPTATEFSDMLTYKNKSFWNGTENVVINPPLAYNNPAVTLENVIPPLTSSTGWSPSGTGSISVANQVLTYTATGSQSYPDVGSVTSIATADNKLILVVAKVKNISGSPANLYIGGASSAGGSNFSLVSGFSGALTPTNGLSYTLFATFRMGVGAPIGTARIKIGRDFNSNPALANGTVMEVQEVMGFDLTTAFGAGNEPTATQFQALLNKVNGGAYFTSLTIPTGQTILDSGRRNYWCDVASPILKPMTNLLGNDGNFGVDSNADGVANGWLASLVSSKSVVNNEQLFTANAQHGQLQEYLKVRAQNVGDIIYFCAYVTSTGAVARVGVYEGTGGGFREVMHSSSGASEFLSTKGTLVTTANASAYIADSRTSAWDVIKVKQAHLLNLTALFGAGNEPSQSQMDGIMQQYLNANGYLNSGQVDTHIPKHIHLVNMAYDSTGGVQTDSKVMSGTAVNLLGSDGNFGTDTNADGLADGWSLASLASKSMTGNVQTFTASAQYGTITNVAVRNASVNDIVYCCCQMLATVAGQARITLAQGTGGLNLSTYHTGGGAFEFLSQRGALFSKADSYVNLQTVATSTWAPIQVKQAHLLNLTAIFGAGNEPTQAEMDAWMKAQSSYITSAPIVVKRVPHMLADGVNDYAVYNSATDIVAANGAVSAFVVFQAKDVVAAVTWMFSLSDGVNTSMWCFVSPTAFNLRIYDSVSGTQDVIKATTPQANRWYSLCAVYDPSTKKIGLSVNGEAIAWSAGLTNGMKKVTRLILGAKADISSFSNDRISEYPVFNKVLSQAEIKQLHNNIANRYSLTKI